MENIITGHLHIGGCSLDTTTEVVLSDDRIDGIIPTGTAAEDAAA